VIKNQAGQGTLFSIVEAVFFKKYSGPCYLFGWTWITSQQSSEVFEQL
jgi:hypothetical protein